MIFVGVDPGGKKRFAEATLFFSQRLPVSLISSRIHSSVDDIIAQVVGVVGEWSELSAIAIAAPLTWSGVASGWRKCDKLARETLPNWMPKTWWRPPNVLPGTIAVQG